MLHSLRHLGVCEAAALSSLLRAFTGVPLRMNGTTMGATCVQGKVVIVLRLVVVTRAVHPSTVSSGVDRSRLSTLDQPIASFILDIQR